MIARIVTRIGHNYPIGALVEVKKTNNDSGWYYASNAEEVDGFPIGTYKQILIESNFELV